MDFDVTAAAGKRRPALRLWPAAAALGAALGGVPAPGAPGAAAGESEAGVPLDPGAPDLAGAATPAASVIEVEEVRRGQRGWGLSVFSGSTPERFEVEVVGVVRNPTPGTSFILARLSGQGLEESGVIAGMSGSPVYLDGRLAGAVAFSWPFTREAIAGITPISEMRRMAEVATRPGARRARADATEAGGEAAPAAPGAPHQGPGAAGAAGGGLRASGTGPAVELHDLVSGEIPDDLLARALGRLRPPLPGGASPSVQWLAGGFGPGATSLLEGGLGPLGLAGEAAGAGEGESEGGDLEPGQMVAAVVVDGDLRLAASGTVTDRTGQQVLAFGHPFLGAGPISVPLARAEVVTVVKSLNSSFKVSNVGPVVGAFEEDRRPGLVGHVGREAHTIPLAVSVEGEAATDFHMRLAELPGFTAPLLASAVVGAIEAVAWRSGEQGLDVEATFALAGHGALGLRQSFDGAGAAIQAASYLLGVADYLMENDLERVTLTGVEVRVRQVERPRTATVVGAHADRTVVRPGERVGLTVDLVAFRGEPFRRSLALTLPHDLPAGRYTLLVGDGSSVDAARLAAEPAAPVNFRQALDLLSSLHSRRDLVVLGLVGGRGLSVAGQAMPRLPGSIRSLWAPVPSGGAAALKHFVAQERVERLDEPISGLVRVDLEVRRREPVAAEPAAGGEEGGAAGEATPEASGQANPEPPPAEPPPAAEERLPS